jgi:YD repeat-containing protein
MPVMERREFLKTGALLPGVRLPSTQTAARSVHSTLDPWVEVHAGHLRLNAAAIHTLTGVPILAVIKNNGYGAGVLNVARALEPAGHIHGFAWDQSPKRSSVNAPAGTSR